MTSYQPKVLSCPIHTDQGLRAVHIEPLDKAIQVVSTPLVVYSKSELHDLVTRMRQSQSGGVDWSRDIAWAHMQVSAPWGTYEGDGPLKVYFAADLYLQQNSNFILDVTNLNWRSYSVRSPSPENLSTRYGIYGNTSPASPGFIGGITEVKIQPFTRITPRKDQHIQIE